MNRGKIFFHSMVYFLYELYHFKENLMKLLIVDDEELTRTGVISAIDWKSLGIREIFQADDGIHGLEAARRYRPEIILCDVRMPRMDGITMLEQVEAILPDTVAIFMSGYSDKEYLKAAIKLKAVNYIEKPINPVEIREAILEAKEVYLGRIRSTRGESLHSMETGSRIALQLTVPYGANAGTIDNLLAELGLSSATFTDFTAFIIQAGAASEQTEVSLSEIYHGFRKLLLAQNMDCFYVEKRGRYMVYFVFGFSASDSRNLSSAAGFLQAQYGSMGNFFIAAGETVNGITKAYRSYASAVVLLQSCFFFPVGTLLTPAFLTDSDNAARHLPDSPDTKFTQALSQRDLAACEALLLDVFRYFDHNVTLLQNQSKDLYFKFFLALEDASRQAGIFSAAGPTETIADTMERCFSYEELHQTLLLRTRHLFTEIQNSVQENPTILLIKNYISRNYMNETLSVKDISAHVFLSMSYVCTFFKNETGQTLNQYLTEYRMEMAKQLLADPRYKISDISSKVGYTDGNYFGKSFKKYTGLSPSEFREKTLK